MKAFGMKILPIFAWIFGFLVASLITRGILSIVNDNGTSATTTPATGFVISRDNYNINCKAGIPAETLASVGDEKALAYCGCTYDQGMSQYGATRFMELLTESGKTNTVGDEMNKIVNDCAYAAR